MYFSDEIFNRKKLDKISDFFLEVLNECCKKLGVDSILNDFLQLNPLFLHHSLKEFCKKILNYVTLLDKNDVETKRNLENFNSMNRSLNLNISNFEKNTKDNTDFEFMKTFIKQYEKKKEKEFRELNWKIDNYKLFMDPQIQSLYEMSFSKRTFEEERAEVLQIKRVYEEEKTLLLIEIKTLKERLKLRDNELLRKERILREKEKNLLLEEEAINIRSLANSFKTREILTKSKKIGEKELLLLIQTKNPHHQPSKSFSNNF